MADAVDAERHQSLRDEYPSSSEGGSDDDGDSLPSSMLARKKQKKKESNDAIAYQNEQQSGLGGRKPRNLANTREHCLVLGQQFGSRFVFPYFSR